MGYLSDYEIRQMRRVSLAENDKLAELAREICHQFGVTIAELKSPTREKREISEARAWFYFWARDRGFSLPAIGRFVGRDHTSVKHGADRIAGLIDRTLKVTQAVTFKSRRGAQ